MDELGFYHSLRETSGILLELETYEVEIYPDSVKHRRYHQLTSGSLNSKMDKLGFYHSLRETNRFLLEFEIYEVEVYHD